VLAAVSLWSRGRVRPVPVYFIGVGEKLEDLQTFDAREFAQALLDLGTPGAPPVLATQVPGRFRAGSSGVGPLSRSSNQVDDGGS
jgi:SRP54-type protein, GTPase domain